MAITLNDLTPHTEPTATPLGDAIKADIADALSRVPKDKSGAIVAYVTQDQTKTVKAVLTVKAGDHWAIAAHVDAPDGDFKRLEYGAAVQFTW